MVRRWWPAPGAFFGIMERQKAKEAAGRMEGELRLLRVIGEKATVLEYFG